MLQNRAFGIACAAMSLLVGCGQPEAGEPQRAAEQLSEQAPVATEADSRPVVVAFGDSLTAGVRVSRQETYPGFLQRELDRRELAFRVVNEGVSGDTTARALARVDVALAHAPAWVILGIGANDGLRGLPIDVMEANLETMIRRFEDGGARVLLAGMMLPRNYGPDYVRDFEAVYPRLAREFDLPLIPFLLENVAMVRDLNQADGIHPNARGNRVVARQVADAFEAVVRK